MAGSFTSGRGWSGQVLLWASMLALAGCSLINPYVRTPELDLTDAATQGRSAQNVERNNELDAAVTLAGKQRKKYYDAISERAKLRNGLPLLLLPLAGHAAYIGLHDLTDKGKTLLLKEGLVGITAYGLAGYYTSTPREQVYLAGIQALSCSIHAFAPYFLSADMAVALGPERTRLVIEESNQVFRLTREVQEQVFLIQRDFPSKDDATKKYLDGILKELKKSVMSYNEARETIRTVGAVNDAVDSAGREMQFSIHEIVVTVDKKLSGIEPDPSKILDITASLAANAQKFAPAGAFTPPAAPKKVEEPGAESQGGGTKQPDAFAKLKALYAELITAVDKLNANVKDQQDASTRLIERIQNARSYPACDAGKPVRPLVVSPADTSVNMYLSKARTFSATGDGFVHMSVSEVGGPVQPVELVVSNDGFTQIAKVTYVKEVPDTNSVILTFRDINQSKKVTLVLVPDPLTPAVVPASASPEAGTPEKVKPAGPKQPALVPPLNPFENKMVAAKVNELQTLIGVPLTGVIDKATRVKLSKLQTELLQTGKWQGSANGTIDAAFLTPFEKFCSERSVPCRAP